MVHFEAHNAGFSSTILRGLSYNPLSRTIYGNDFRVADFVENFKKSGAQNFQMEQNRVERRLRRLQEQKALEQLQDGDSRDMLRRVQVE